MAPPLLKLAFVKGPREGETLEYKPGSTIRIGRVVRGNEIAIKDAGISTKHLRIVSDSEHWMIHDLGSSNGTTLNSETLDADNPVALSRGDEIKLGEYTSIVVIFETDVQAEEEEEEPKLPPRPRRNTRRNPEPVQEKPTRRGRSAKLLEEPEPPPPKRATRATRSKAAITKEEGEAVPMEKKGNPRARGGKKNAEAVLDSMKLEIEETPKGVEMSSMKRVTRSSRKIGNVKSHEDTGLEEMRMPSRATRSKRKEIGEDSYLDLDMVLSQARAKKKKVEQKIFVEEMEARDDGVEEDKENEKDVEAQKGGIETSGKEDDVPKSVEHVEIETRKSTLGKEGVEEDNENEMEVSDKEGETSKRVEQVEIVSRKSTVGEEDIVEDKENEMEVIDKEDETSKRVEQVEIEPRKSTLGEEDVVDKENEMDVSDKDDETCKRVEQMEIDSRKSTLGEDGEAENLQDAVEEEGDCKRDEAGVETSNGECDEEEEEKAEQESKNVEKVDLEKMTLGDWFKYMEVYLRKKIVDETEEMIEGMRAKSRRVHQYIAEQKQLQAHGK